MANNNKLHEQLKEVLKSGSPVITAATIDNKGVMQSVQLYFEADGEAVMDVISKDDLVQNFPEEGVYVLAGGNCNCKLKKVEMFEGEEDMYFRTDGTHTESDEFSSVPSVEFMEGVEFISTLKL